MLVAFSWLSQSNRVEGNLLQWFRYETSSLVALSVLSLYARADSLSLAVARSPVAKRSVLAPHYEKSVIEPDVSRDRLQVRFNVYGTSMPSCHSASTPVSLDRLIFTGCHFY